MTTSPIQFQILPDTSLKVKSSSTDNCTTSKSIHQSTSYPHCPDWWRRPSKRTEKIIHQSPINSMPIMPPPRILLPWRLSSVKKPWLRRITLIFSSWRDSKKNLSRKDSMSQEDCTTHWTWLGNCFQFIHKKVCPRSQLISSKSITRRDSTKMRMKKKKNEEMILQNLLLSILKYLINIYKLYNYWIKGKIYF